jgi:hypothetical protein
VIVSRDGTGQPVKIPARPVPWEEFELVPLSLCPGTTRKLLSLCPEKLHCPVPLETLVYTSVFTGRDVPRDVPGQTGTGRPVVPLSRDKEIFLSRCPFVPGQGQKQMSRDKPLCPGTSRDKITLLKKPKNRKKSL